MSFVHLLESCHITADSFKALVRFRNRCMGRRMQTFTSYEIKDALYNLPVLSSIDLSKRSIVSSDASSRTIGAVLTHKDDNVHDHLMQYASWSLNDAEKKSCYLARGSGDNINLGKAKVLLSIPQTCIVDGSWSPLLCFQ